MMFYQLHILFGVEIYKRIIRRAEKGGNESLWQLF